MGLTRIVGHPVCITAAVHGQFDWLDLRPLGSVVCFVAGAIKLRWQAGVAVF